MNKSVYVCGLLSLYLCLCACSCVCWRASVCLCVCMCVYVCRNHLWPRLCVCVCVCGRVCVYLCESVSAAAMCVQMAESNNRLYDIQRLSGRHSTVMHMSAWWVVLRSQNCVSARKGLCSIKLPSLFLLPPVVQS